MFRWIDACNLWNQWNSKSWHDLEFVHCQPSQLLECKFSSFPTIPSHVSRQHDHKIIQLWQGQDWVSCKVWPCALLQAAPRIVLSRAGEFVLMFDKSLNITTKSKQMDLQLRFWHYGEVQSYNFGSQFMGHSRSQDLLDAVKQPSRAVSMDGPNMNLKFLNLLQQEQANVGGRQLLTVGSCGLHTLHSAFKSGMCGKWEVMKALLMLFHNLPAQTNFCEVRKFDPFPLPFHAHCWVENLLLRWPLKYG